jgi:hypothetical protein
MEKTYGSLGHHSTTTTIVGLGVQLQPTTRDICFLFINDETVLSGDGPPGCKEPRVTAEHTVITVKPPYPPSLFSVTDIAGDIKGRFI